jgi:hypothetical protein
VRAKGYIEIHQNILIGCNDFLKIVIVHQDDIILSWKLLLLFCLACADDGNENGYIEEG